MKINDLYDFVPTVRSIIEAAKIAHSSDGTQQDYRALTSLVEKLSVPERNTLVSLLWLGRDSMPLEAGLKHAQEQQIDADYIANKSPLANYLQAGLEKSGVYQYHYQPHMMVNGKLREVVAKMHNDGYIPEDGIPALQERLRATLHEYLIDATTCKVTGCEGRTELIHNDLMGQTGWRVWKCDNCGSETANRAAPELHNWPPTLPGTGT